MRNRNWYALHTYSGHEDNVKLNIEKRAEMLGMIDQVFEVLVPKQTESKHKDGKKQEIQKKVFPGYVLVDMVLSDDVWHLIKDTSGVIGFVSSGDKPVPLKRREVQAILDTLKNNEAKPVPKWQVGEVVRINDGPFADFSGRIEEILLQKEKVKILVEFFGRDTPVELKYDQIEKI